MANELIKLERATNALAEAKTLDEVKHIIDVAEAARVYSRAAKLGLEAYNHAAEVKARAERKAGEFLARLERGIPKPFNRALNGSEYKGILDENKISYMAAHRWQQVNEMPEEVFEAHIAKMKGEQPISTGAILKEIKEEKREQTRHELAQTGSNIQPSEKWHIYHGDIATIKLDKQYDFIITDPPYPKEYLPLWETLAIRSKEFLKPDGLLIAMSGQLYLNKIYAIMDKYLSYYWTACYLALHQPTPLRTRNVNTTWKPILIYGLSDKYNGKIFGDVYQSPQPEKTNHDWEQSVEGMYELIKQICLPGQSILDPFCGSGSTGIAAMQHHCLFDGVDVEIENVNISKARLHDTEKK